jgi:hypothetical protein
MTLPDHILETIERVPGCTKQELACRFGLSSYRLNRVLRQLERRLCSQTVVHDEENGVWIVEVDPEKCKGMVWIGVGSSGYRQCTAEPEFDDGCCYDHSQCENLEITAFMRELAFRAGPREPSAHGISQIGMAGVEDLIARLRKLKPLTRKDVLTKKRVLGSLMAAMALLKWKELMRRRAREDWIPPELRQRHRESSINPFEYSLRKYFTLLEVRANSTRQEVLAAWRRLARRDHPDVPGGDVEKMKIVNLAKDRIFRLKRWD